jgi:general L-amino acid transport system substrate-binding protein
VLALVAGSAQAESGDTFRVIRARGVLRCGVSEGITGFSQRDETGRWSGIDVDFCRAVAAAVLGDASKVRFQPLSARARFPALASREIDILARNTTWSVVREATFSVLFVGVLYYDSQGLMARADSPFAHGDSLDGAKVCVEQGSNQLPDLTEYSRIKNWHITPLVLPSFSAAHKAMLDGACPILTDDLSALTEMLLHVPDPAAYVIRPDHISKEPLGPVVRWDDGQWAVIVRAVYAALLDADEHGLTQQRARVIGPEGGDAEATAYLAATAPIGQALGLAPNWAAMAVGSVGNYGEMFDRDLGAASPLKLDRGVNRPWTAGGLLYAPPFR